MASDEEIKSEDELPIEDIKIEDTMQSEEYIHYEYLRESPFSIGKSSDENVCSDSAIKSDNEYDQTDSRNLVDGSIQNVVVPRRSRGRPPKRLICENINPKSKSHGNESIQTERAPKRGRGRPRKHPVNAGSRTLVETFQDKAAPLRRCSYPFTQPKSEPDSSPSRQSESHHSPPRNTSELDSDGSAPKIKSKPDSDYSPPRNPSESDSDYSPPKNLRSKTTPDPQKLSERSTFNLEFTNVINNRMNLKNYKRTVNRPDCIFIDCALKDTLVIPNLVRIKILQEYKLYILQSSKACSKHMRDQNWEELLKCTYNDFTAKNIEDILQLLKQASHISFDFENIELISTRLIRYWMNVNKVQYQRIYSKFPSLQALNSPKTALAVYLMYLQKDDVERIAMLLQISETEIMDKIQSVKAIIPCKNYNELNDMFKLEY